MKSPTERGHLYFISSPKQEAVKVGFAVSTSSRLSTLQTGNPHPLQIDLGIPVEFAAEREFHEFMRPHRIAREWYPADILLDMLSDALLEAWEDKVIDATPESAEAWPMTAAYWVNDADVWLTGRDMRRLLPQLMREFFEPDPDDPTPLGIVNHWVNA